MTDDQKTTALITLVLAAFAAFAAPAGWGWTVFWTLVLLAPDKSGGR